MLDTATTQKDTAQGHVERNTTKEYNHSGSNTCVIIIVLILWDEHIGGCLLNGGNARMLEVLGDWRSTLGC